MATDGRGKRSGFDCVVRAAAGGRLAAAEPR
jgi:hypothetical protein